MTTRASWILLLSFLSCASKTPRDSAAEFVGTLGARLRVIERGPPHLRPIILIHGGPGLAGYMGTLGELTPTHHTIEYYQRDAVNSPSAGPFKVANFVEDLRDLVRHYSPVGGPKPVLLGHSWGATLALEYAKLYSREVSAVIIVSPGTMTPAMGKQFGETIFSRLGPNQARARKMFQVLVKKGKEKVPDLGDYLQEYLKVIGPAYFYDYAKGRPGALGETKLKESPANSAAHQEINDDYWKKVYSGDIVAGLKNISAPVYHFQPDYDINPAPELIRILKSNIRDYHLQHLKKMGHFPWLEPQPDRFTKPLEKALKEIEAALEKS